MESADWKISNITRTNYLKLFLNTYSTQLFTMKQEVRGFTLTQTQRSHTIASCCELFATNNKKRN